MSEKEFDWNDDLDFESLADEKEMTAEFGDGEDNFSDFEDLADYADSPEDEDPGSMDMGAVGEVAAAVTSVADELPEPEELDVQDTVPVATMSHKEKNVLSPTGLGFLIATFTLVGALGLAGAVMVSFGLDPLALWNPAGLSSFDQMVNFRDNPINIFYLVTLSIVLLSFMGAWSVVRRARKANERVHRSEGLLSRVTALRLDNELAWTSEEFKADPDTSAFVTDILGAWRLQQARQIRSVGVEGELRRLEKAVRENSRADLADRYDHPLVGSMADAMTHLYDDRDAARKEADATRNKDELETGEIMSLIEDSRSWTQANRQRVDVQGSTLKRWAEKFDELASKFERESGQNEAIAGLQGLQKDLARSLENNAADSLASLDDLVDRGSKLAFQIAMEVARLGPRGERLLPMSQSLEELTTQFRQTATKAKSGGQDSMANPQAVLTRLEQIIVQLVKDGPGGSGHLVRTLQDLVPATGKLAQNLEEISYQFDQQNTRLNSLGTTFADLASLEFDPENMQEGEPANPPEGGLNIAHNDPFGNSKAKPEETVEVDPFASSEATMSNLGTQLTDTGITTDVTPGSEDAFQVESLDATSAFNMEPRTEEPVESLVEPEVESLSEPDLSREEEKVYDLAEFGAVRIDQVNDPVASTEDEDKIYDLAEFGAVAVN